MPFRSFLLDERVCVFVCVSVCFGVLKHTKRNIPTYDTAMLKSKNTHHAFKRFPPSYSKSLEKDRPIHTYV